MFLLTSEEWRYGDIHKTSFSSIFPKMLFYIAFFFSILAMGKHIGGNIKYSLCICIKFVERGPKDVWKISPGSVYVMTFFRRPDNFNLTYSINFIIATFLKYSFSIPPGGKNNWVYLISNKLWRDVPRVS